MQLEPVLRLKSVANFLYKRTTKYAAVSLAKIRFERIQIPARTDGREQVIQNEYAIIYWPHSLLPMHNTEAYAFTTHIYADTQCRLKNH